MAINHHPTRTPTQPRRQPRPTSAAVYDQECDPDLSGGWPPLHRGGCARTPRPSPRHRPSLSPPSPYKLPTNHPRPGGVQPAAAAAAERRRGSREQTRPWLVITWDWRLSGWLLWTCGEGEGGFGGVVFWLHCRCISPSFFLLFFPSFFSFSLSFFELEGVRCMLHLFGMEGNYEMMNRSNFFTKLDRKWIIIFRISCEERLYILFFKYNLAMMSMLMRNVNSKSRFDSFVRRKFSKESFI